MTKPHYTIDQHRAFGVRLKQVKRQLMEERSSRLTLSYPQQRVQMITLSKAIKAVEEVQSVMDDTLCSEYPSVPNSEIGRIYYGPET